MTTDDARDKIRRKLAERIVEHMEAVAVASEALLTLGDELPEREAADAYLLAITLAYRARAVAALAEVIASGDELTVIVAPPSETVH